jgi:hypothetical protein
MQMGVEEFLAHFISRVFGELKESVTINDEVQGEIKTSFRNSTEVFACSTEVFSVMSQTTKDLSSQEEAREDASSRAAPHSKGAESEYVPVAASEEVAAQCHCAAAALGLPACD